MPATLPVAEPTQLMPVTAGHELGPVAGRPAAGVDTHSLRLGVYEALVEENPYFRVGSAGNSPELPTAWQAGNARAEAVSTAAAAAAGGFTEQHLATRNGLPVRRPGAFAMPAPVTAPVVIPAQRAGDRAATRRGMAALSRKTRTPLRHSLPEQIG